MCGITGWFSSAPLPPTAVDQLGAMTRALQHRGPDGSGHLIRPHAALGHVRLAIIDIDGGAQPMSTADDQISIVFNGEIYNFRELQTTLKQRGAVFRSHSDTEVILHLYRQEGWRGFSRLRGMYAFAIWDQTTQSGLLVRDPQGIKPLFISDTRDGLAFASEAKALIAASGSRATLDTAALHLCMNFRYLPGNHSLFEGIEQLSPGTVLHWSRHDKTKRSVLDTPSFSDCAAPLDELRSSVAAHLTSDVEVGSYLSGGIDSAIITALANESSRAKLRTFTLAVGDDSSEAAQAARTAELLGNANIQSSLPEDLSDTLPRLIWHLEVPKINALQVHALARAARRHVKVALSGLGGDELFLGYNAHRIMHQANTLHSALPSFFSRITGTVASGITRSISSMPWSEPERAMVMLQQLGNWPRVYAVLRNVWDNPALRQRIYGPRMLDTTLPNAFSTIESLWPSERDPVMAMAEFEWQQKMVNDLLWQEDRVSMAEGLEVRVPFVDLRLKHCLSGLSRHTLMANGRPKRYMRKLVSEVLPREILDRPKSGFQVDSPAFFHRHLRQWENTLLSPDHVSRVGLFNPAFVESVRRYPIEKRSRWHYFMLYLILGTHLWVEIFENRQWPTHA